MVPDCWGVNILIAKYSEKSGGILVKPKNNHYWNWEKEIVPKKVLFLSGGKKIKIYSEMSTKKEEAVRLSGSIASVLYKTEKVLPIPKPAGEQ